MSPKGGLFGGWRVLKIHIQLKTMKDPNKFFISIENQNDFETIESILNQSFGKNRIKRTVYKFRYGNPVKDLCLVLKYLDKEFENSKILASIRYWPIMFSDVKGLILGPLAVQKELQGSGFGKKLLRFSLIMARKQRWKFCFVSGEYHYFKQFGFNQIPKNRDINRALNQLPPFVSILCQF